MEILEPVYKVGTPSTITTISEAGHTSISRKQKGGEYASPTHFMHWIEQLGLEHVCHVQFSHLDRKYCMLLYVFQCLANSSNCSHRKPSSDSWF